MKRLFIMIIAALTLCLVFAACGADPGDNTKDGTIGDGDNAVQKTAQKIADEATHMRKDAAKTVRDTVAEYYRTRMGVYGGYERGTVGREFAAGYNGDGTSTSNRLNWADVERYLGTGIVQDGFDTNANTASDSSSSAEVSDPIAKSGLVRNGSSNID